MARYKFYIVLCCIDGRKWLSRCDTEAARWFPVAFLVGLLAIPADGTATAPLTALSLASKRFYM